ncbi:hypothetical protein QTL97_17500, partial [Sporosarcina thermotolerans]
ASFKMSISNPKIRFVLFTDRVGSRTLFVDVLLFSFQGSFVCRSVRSNSYIIPRCDFDVNNYFRKILSCFEVVIHLSETQRYLLYQLVFFNATLLS